MVIARTLRAIKSSWCILFHQHGWIALRTREGRARWFCAKCEIVWTQ